MTRGDDPGADKLPLLPTMSAANLAGKPIPARQWLIEDLIPARAVTILNGDGGVGKGLLASQLGVAVATGTDWIGLQPALVGASLHVSAEDDADEMHRRLADIVSGSGGSLKMADLRDVHIIPLAGRDAVLAVTSERGIVTQTRLWRSVEQELNTLSPRLLIIENLADVFAGNEISRSEARQFISLLRGAAVDHNLAVLLIAHPSLAGMTNGGGSSGSTAWSNSVRARLYLDRIKGEQGHEHNPDVRVLTVRKSNYGPVGAEVRMQYVTGRFVAKGQPSMGALSRVDAERKADVAFLKLLAMYQSQGRHVSPNKSSSFAPKLLSQEADAEGFSSKAFEAAMSRLLKQGTIKVEIFGPPSKSRSRLVIV